MQIDRFGGFLANEDLEAAARQCVEYADVVLPKITSLLGEKTRKSLPDPVFVFWYEDEPTSFAVAYRGKRPSPEQLGIILQTNCAAPSSSMYSLRSDAIYFSVRDYQFVRDFQSKREREMSLAEELAHFAVGGLAKTLVFSGAKNAPKGSIGEFANKLLVCCPRYFISSTEFYATLAVSHLVGRSESGIAQLNSEARELFRSDSYFNDPLSDSITLHRIGNAFEHLPQIAAEMLCRNKRPEELAAETTRLPDETLLEQYVYPVRFPFALPEKFPEYGTIHPSVKSAVERQFEEFLQTPQAGFF
ncbi:MAG: hypothetical protein V1820_05795 [archaeon]